MPATDFDTERTYSDDQFSAQGVYSSDRMKLVCGYFEPGQFIPGHAPGSDVAVHARGPASSARARPTTRSNPATWSSSPPTWTAA
jgi:hypothetical protein